MGERVHSISEIAKLCNLSQKQVRYYEEQGLIGSVPRNPDNNYRYYTQEHVKQLFIIREYLLFGFSLDEIYKLLHESSISTMKDSIRRRVKLARENLRISVLEYEKGAEKFAQIMEAVALLEANLQTKGVNGSNSYEINKYEDMEVVSITHEGTFFDEDKLSKEYLAELYVIAEQYQLTLVGPLIFQYFDHFTAEQGEFNYGRRKVEISFPVIELKSNCSYCKRLSGFKGVSTVHYGDYDERLVEEYKRLRQWGFNQGYKLANTAMEEYLIGSEMTTKKELWVTRITIPIVD